MLQRDVISMSRPISSKLTSTLFISLSQAEFVCFIGKGNFWPEKNQEQNHLSLLQSLNASLELAQRQVGKNCPGSSKYCNYEGYDYREHRTLLCQYPTAAKHTRSRFSDNKVFKEPGMTEKILHMQLLVNKVPHRCQSFSGVFVILRIGTHGIYNPLRALTANDKVTEGLKHTVKRTLQAFLAEKSCIQVQLNIVHRKKPACGITQIAFCYNSAVSSDSD